MEETIPGDALFIFTGATPRTDWVAGTIERDEDGFILSGADVMRDGNPPLGWPLERDPYWLESKCHRVSSPVMCVMDRSSGRLSHRRRRHGRTAHSRPPGRSIAAASGVGCCS